MINGLICNKLNKIYLTSKPIMELIRLSLCGLLTQNASVKLSKVKMILGKTSKLPSKNLMSMFLPVQSTQLPLS